MTPWSPLALSDADADRTYRLDAVDAARDDLQRVCLPQPRREPPRDGVREREPPRTVRMQRDVVVVDARLDAGTAFNCAALANWYQLVAGAAVANRSMRER